MGFFQGVVGLKKIPWVSFRGWWGDRRYHGSLSGGGGGSYKRYHGSLSGGREAIDDTMNIPMRGRGGIMEAIGVRIGVGGYHKRQ